MENFIFAEWFDFIFTSIIGILLGITLFFKKIRAKRNFLTFFYLLVILCCGFIFPKLSFELQQDYLYKNPKADLLEFGGSIQLRRLLYKWYHVLNIKHNANMNMIKLKIPGIIVSDTQHNIGLYVRGPQIQECRVTLYAFCQHDSLLFI